MRRLLFSCAALLAAASAAAAEPATPEGAQRIADSYAAYLSRKVLDSGALTVKAQAEDYFVAWDFRKALAALGASALAMTADPFVYRLTPTLGGGWVIKSSAAPTLTFGQNGKGGSVAFDAYRLDGLIDPDAPERLRLEQDVGALKLDVRIPQGAATRRVLFAESANQTSLTAKASRDAGAVDVRSQGRAETIENASALVGVDGVETPLGGVRQSGVKGDGELSGLRAAEIADLWRFLVAGGGADKMPTDVLRAKLAAILPVWRAASGKTAADDVALSFAGGSATLKSLVEAFAITGVLPAASARLALSFKDARAEIAAAPDWAKAIWPVSLDFALEGRLDGLDGIAALALDDAQLLETGKLTPATRDRLAASLRDGHPRLTLSPSRIGSPLVEATFEGEAALVDGAIDAHATITADDLDRLLSALGASEDPNARQTLFLVTFAKGLARTEGGHLIWKIDYTPPDHIEVNGQSFSTK